MNDNVDEQIDDTLTNNILIIGNGFDLANGYKTSYTDFITFIKNKEYLKYDLDDTRYEFEEIVKKNHFIKHFIDSNDYKLWCDIETEIHRIIKAISSVYRDDGTHLEYTKVAFDENIVKVKEINPIVEKILLEFELIKLNYGNYVVNDDYYDYERGIKWVSLNNYLNDEFISFKALLVLYLKEYVPKIYEMNKKQISEKMQEQFKSINPKQIITFNYTNYYTNYYNTKKINHVHGSLTNGEIVLGFEDDESIDYRYIRFKKFFQRMQYNLNLIDESGEPLNRKDEFLSELIEEDVDYDNVLHIYGFSFDYADEDYIRILINNKSNIKINIYYYDDSDYDQKIANLIRIFKKNEFLKLYKNKIKMIRIPQ